MVIHKVIKMLAEILSIEPEDISPKMALTKDNGVDPIDVASLVIACEKEFKINLFDELVLEFASVADLAAHIDKMLADGLFDAPEITEEDRTAWFYE